MTTADPSLAPFYQGCETYQGYLTNAIAPLTSEQLALCAASHLRSIGLLVAHIIAARVIWFHANWAKDLPISCRCARGMNTIPSGRTPPNWLLGWRPPGAGSVRIRKMAC
ncbi:MAG TPA: hypothetical protein VIY29_11195, partial [Ktedonobacteraceae bacterium]